MITASAVQTTITIDPHYGATFAPPPVNVSAPALTAQQAWAQFIQSSTVGSGTAIPSTVTAQLGLFTLPIQTAAQRAAAIPSRTASPTPR